MAAQVELWLAQVASVFRVRDIMIDVDRMVRADTPDEAFQRLAEFTDFDCIPIPASGPVESYLYRGASAVENILRQDLISDGTSTTAALTRGVGDDGYARVWPALGDGDATQTSAERRLELEGPARAARRVIGALLAR